MEGVKVLIADMACRSVRRFAAACAAKHGVPGGGAPGADSVAVVIGGDFNSHPGPHFDPFKPPPVRGLWDEACACRKIRALGGGG
jgi:hypothetical protein